MNSKDLYKAIGEIDDSLIEEALVIPKKNSYIKYIKKSYVATACLIIAIITMFSLHNKKNTLNTIYFNNISYIATKIKQPQNNDIAYKKIISFNEATEYLNTIAFSKLTLFNYNLIDNTYIIYFNKNNDINYDLIKFDYINKLDTKKQIIIYTSKLGIYYDYNIIGLDKSCTINNTNIYLGKCKLKKEYNESEKLYYAKFSKNSITFTIITNNLSENEFLNIINSLTEV